MSGYLTEEEQIEAFKRWWKENGTATLGAILLGALVYVGVGFWESAKNNRAVLVSSYYDQFAEIAETSNTAALSAEQASELQDLSSKIIEEDRDSLYADLASFFLAKDAVTNDKYDAAADHLNRIIQDSASEVSKQLAKLRLAKVLAAQGKNSEAVSLINNTPLKSFEASFAEARGDIHLAQGQLDQARTAYQAAMTAMTAAGGPQSQRASLIQFKLDSAKVASVNPLEAPAMPGNPHAVNPHAVNPHANPHSSGVADSAEADK